MKIFQSKISSIHILICVEDDVTRKTRFLHGLEVQGSVKVLANTFVS